MNLDHMGAKQIHSIIHNMTHAYLAWTLFYGAVGLLAWVFAFLHARGHVHRYDQKRRRLAIVAFLTSAVVFTVQCIIHALLLTGTARMTGTFSHWISRSSIAAGLVTIVLLTAVVRTGANNPR